MIRRFALPLALATLAALPAQAGNVTRQQSCQIMARHVVAILNTRDWKDEAAKEIGVLKLYAAEQSKIIAKEIKASAAQLPQSEAEIKAMVDQQGDTLKTAVETRYGTEKLYRDYAVSLFECAKASPKRLGSSPEVFVATLEKIGAWAQAGR